MRFVDLFNAISSGGSPPLAVVENHYLPFDGVADHGYCDGAFPASGAYTIAIKVARRATSGFYYFAATDGTSHRDSCYRDTNKITWTGSFSLSSGINIPNDDSTRVIAAKRDAAGAYGTGVVVSSAGNEFSGDDVTVTYAMPTRMAVGARVNTTAAAFSNIWFISALIATSEVSDADLLTWLSGGTAEHIASLSHYWVASDINGASIPARVGTVPLTLVGPVAGDLVAWP